MVRLQSYHCESLNYFESGLNTEDIPQHVNLVSLNHVKIKY